MSLGENDALKLHENLGGDVQRTLNSNSNRTWREKGCGVGGKDTLK